MQPRELEPSFELPPVRVDDGAQRTLSQQARLEIKTVRIRGNTVLDNALLEAAAAPFVGRVVSTLELESLRRALSELYINAGYLNSGVLLPDQRVTDGQVTFQVVEGQLSSIDVKGTVRLNPGYIASRMPARHAGPLNVEALRESLALLQADRLVKRIAGTLRPGAALGQSVLELNVEEARPYDVGFTVDNHRAASVGEFRGTVQLAHRNLTGWGDSLQLNFDKSSGARDFQLGYGVPLNANDTRLSLSFRAVDSSVVEEPLDQLEIENQSREWSFGISHPIVKRIARHVEIGATLVHREARTRLLDIPFSFSPGVQDGEAQVSVLRAHVSWLERDSEQVLALRSTFNLGLDALGSTINADAPDSRFFSWLGQVQWARRFADGAYEFILRSDVQLSGEALLALEQFGVGGRHSVRGYRESTLVRDNGWVSSAELRVPLRVGVTLPARVQLAVFADHGWSWSTDAETSDPLSLSSVGLGLRVQASEHVYGEIYGAIGLTDLDSTGTSLQDKGIHALWNYHY